VRIFNTYALALIPATDGSSPTQHAALRGEPLTIYGEGQTRSFCYVDDLIEGILRLSRSKNTAVNIGNPGEFTILECAHAVLEVTGSRANCALKPCPEDDPHTPLARHRQGPRPARLGTAHHVKKAAQVAGVLSSKAAGADRVMFSSGRLEYHH